MILNVTNIVRDIVSLPSGKSIRHGRTEPINISDDAYTTVESGGSPDNLSGQARKDFDDYLSLKQLVTAGKILMSNATSSEIYAIDGIYIARTDIYWLGIPSPCEIVSFGIGIRTISADADCQLLTKDDDIIADLDIPSASYSAGDVVYTENIVAEFAEQDAWSSLKVTANSTAGFDGLLSIGYRRRV